MADHFADQLTGAWNRAHLDRVIESELSRSNRFRQPLSLILLGIDHFKRINDTYGHQAGDVVLRELVTAIHKNIRAADVLFRWGDEEFVVLTASTGYRNAQTLAETLRAAVAAHDYTGVGTVTISLGVAEHSGGESAAAWFSRLHAALYAAKNSGRNRVFSQGRARRADRQNRKAEAARSERQHHLRRGGRISDQGRCRAPSAAGRPLFLPAVQRGQP